MKSEEGYVLQTYVNCEQQNFFYQNLELKKGQNGLGQNKAKV